MSGKMNPRTLRTAIFIIADIACIVSAVYISLFLRSDFIFSEIDPLYYTRALCYLPVDIAVTLFMFYLMRFYHTLWQFASIKEYSFIVLGAVFSTAVNTLLRYVLGLELPRSCIVLSCAVLACLTFGYRLVYRIIFRHNSSKADPSGRISNVMIIGAGEAASMLLREFHMNSRDSSKKVVCVIDDDPQKKNQRIWGIRVVGGRNAIPDSVDRYDVNEIIFAMPSASPSTRAEILNICKGLRCTMKTLPSASQIINHEVSLASLEDVDVDDLLGRDPIRADIDSFTGYIKGQVVLVTGGGGSIGSELCRQIAAHSPSRLVIFDVYENSAYDIQNELIRSFPNLTLTVLIGSVRDSKRIESVFETYRPSIVFHAAAHKHVPLMEDSPNEAVKNNVFGTYKTAVAADKYGAERFILISTDKAVNPTNVMGASKRLCEMVIQTFATTSKTVFSAVRFGNVLGSNGSVIPLFKKQIAAGGPVTVTHPDIIRFFMTIPEAVGLVLKAGAIAKSGEIMVLDMGHPVKILDLAENLIRLSGKTPYVDVDIIFTGLRPGEKLYEEMLTDEEGLNASSDDMIFTSRPLGFDAEKFKIELEHLRQIMYDDNCDIKGEISKIVPIREAANK